MVYVVAHRALPANVDQHPAKRCDQHKRGRIMSVTDDHAEQIAELDRTISNLEARGWSGNKLAWTWLENACVERETLTGETCDRHKCTCEEDWQ